jgi:hypothetical protein
MHVALLVSCVLTQPNADPPETIMPIINDWPCARMDPMSKPRNVTFDVSSGAAAMSSLPSLIFELSFMIRPLIFSIAQPCWWKKDIFSYTCDVSRLPTQDLCEEAMEDPWLFWPLFKQELLGIGESILYVLTNILPPLRPFIPEEFKSARDAFDQILHGTGYLNRSLHFVYTKSSDLALASMAFSYRYAQSVPWTGDAPFFVNGNVVKGRSVWCPQEHRSMSGCGDFNNVAMSRQRLPMPEDGPDPYELADPALHHVDRQDCAADFKPRDDYLLVISVDPKTEKKYMDLSDEWRMPNVAVYINYTSLWPAHGRHYPLTIGPHRPIPPKWGRYAYLPEARWMHHIAMGGVAFLHHPCLAMKDVCALEGFAKGLENQSAYRWVHTPYKSLPAGIAIATYGHLYMADKLNEADAAAFVHLNTKPAPDMGDKRDAWIANQGGTYDYLRFPGSTACSLYADTDGPPRRPAPPESHIPGAATVAKNDQTRISHFTLLMIGFLGASVALVAMRPAMAHTAPLY